MRFSVVSYGSEGDTRPIAAVCRGLMDAGHDPYMFCEQSSLGIVKDHGIPSEALSGGIKSTLPLDNPSGELRGRDVFKAIAAGARMIRSNTASWMETVAGHARESDMILMSGLALPMAHRVALALNKPSIPLWLQPTTPTREFPSAALPPLKLPAWANKLTYFMSPHAMAHRLGGKAANAAARRLFGAPRRGAVHESAPILYGFSRHLVSRPIDWPDNHQICGAWNLPSADWKAPRELIEFLSAGPPPLYIGFGAVSSFIRRRRLNEIVAAIAGRRALFYPGWSNISADMLPSNFLMIGHTSHAWLFPRTSMVIHHGGAGTTHTAAAAGVPSIALPVGADQLYWADRLATAGVAPKYIQATKIDAASLSKMIVFAEQTAVRDRAKALGAAMSKECGVATAVKAIERGVSGMVRGDR